MTDILSILQTGANVSLTVTPQDLFDFAKNVIELTKEQMLPIMVTAAQTTLLSRKAVSEKLALCDVTIYNWRKSGYLEAVKVGRKVFYRQEDVLKTLELHGDKNGK
ncbi:MAG: helix-turn-helix domain-containing protein [Muribaculaceae bacterium]